MKKVIWKAYYNYEKEEQWLNQMCAKGLALTDYSWCRYVFEDCQPGQYIYRLELLDHFANNIESQRYIQFLEENGIQHVASYRQWIFVRKEAKDGPFEIYTDNESRLNYYKKVSNFWTAIMFAELAIGLSNLGLGFSHQLTGSIGSSIFGLNFGVGITATLVGIMFYRVRKPIKDKIHILNKEMQLRE